MIDTWRNEPAPASPWHTARSQGGPWKRWHDNGDAQPDAGDVPAGCRRRPAGCRRCAAARPLAGPPAFPAPVPGRWGRRPRSSGPLRRGREDRLVGGVAAGLAARTGFDVTVVRTVFVVAALLGGFGAAAYVAGLAAGARRRRGQQHREQGADRPAGHRAGGRSRVAARRGTPHRVGARRRLARLAGLAARYQCGRPRADLEKRPGGRAGDDAAPGRAAAGMERRQQAITDRAAGVDREPAAGRRPCRAAGPGTRARRCCARWVASYS